MNTPDAFDDLDSLRLPAEAAAAVTPTSRNVGRGTPRSKRPRIAANFYLCPIDWADHALGAVGSKEQFVIALRLYRCWRLRSPKQDMIIASNAALAGPGFSREKKRRAIQGLQAAGLIEVVDHQDGRAPRVRIVE